MKKKIIIGVVIFLILLLGVGSYFIFFNKDKDTKPATNNKDEKITITFDSDGGTKVEDMKVKKGSSFQLPETTKEGYTFVGWYNGSKLYTDDDTASIKKDIVLTAKWEENKKEITELKVTFDSKGGSKVKDVTFKCTDEVATIKNLSKPTKDGYNFMSWEDKHGKSILDGASIVCDGTDLKLYAVWEKKEDTKPTTKVTYKCDEGTLSGDKCIITKDAKTKCPGSTYEFNGKCITLTYQAQNSYQVTRVCGKTTVVVDAHGHTEQVQGEVKYAGYYYCAYSQVSESQYECTSHGYKWIDSKCYRTYTGPGVNITYSCKVSTNYIYLTTDQSNSLRQNSNLSGCFPYTSKVPYCEEDYSLKDSKCVKTIDATLE